MNHNWWFSCYFWLDPKVTKRSRLFCYFSLERKVTKSSRLNRLGYSGQRLRCRLRNSLRSDIAPSLLRFCKKSYEILSFLTLIHCSFSIYTLKSFSIHYLQTRYFILHFSLLHETLPASIWYTSSAIPIVDSLWDTSTTVLPLLSSLSDFKIIPSFKESKLLVGSSIKLGSPLPSL